MKTEIENKDMIVFLEKLSAAGRKGEKESVYKRAYDIASRARRQRISVNLNKIDRCASAGESVLVPGKVLGVGHISKKVSICAISYSSEALLKLKGSGCSIIGVDEAIKATKIRLIA